MTRKHVSPFQRQYFSTLKKSCIRKISSFIELQTTFAGVYRNWYPYSLKVKEDCHRALWTWSQCQLWSCLAVDESAFNSDLLAHPERRNRVSTTASSRALHRGYSWQSGLQSHSHSHRFFPSWHRNKYVSVSNWNKHGTAQRCNKTPCSRNKAMPFASRKFHDSISSCSAGKYYKGAEARKCDKI